MEREGEGRLVSPERKTDLTDLTFFIPNQYRKRYPSVMTSASRLKAKGMPHSSTNTRYVM